MEGLLFQTIISRVFLLICSCELISGKRYLNDEVTCGSVTKLLNVRQNVRLHSHEVKYGSGSGQQSVTAIEDVGDHNSYWRIQSKVGAPASACARGTPVKCGQTVRLTHVNTGKNLHSHHFQSPLSHNLEVSAFGEGGEGDDGDNWVVVCAGKHWKRDERVRFKHVATDHYLHVSGDSYGRPIHGQREVSGYSQQNDLNYWRAAEGVFVRPTVQSGSGNIHDEF